MEQTPSVKKQIVIVSYSMGIGGVERALLGLLHAIDYSKIDVTLKLARVQGELLCNIPTEVRIEQIDCISNNWKLFNKPLYPIIVSYLKRPKTLLKGLLLGCDYLLFKTQGHYHILFRHLLKNDLTHYDLALSYAGPSSLLDYYVANCVNATKKASWIHYDLNKFAINKKSLSSLYSSFDKIFVVSEDGKIIFDKIFPEFKSKSAVFHNMIDPDEIRRLASVEDTCTHSKGINCVLVGRLSREKGQDLAIEAIAKLKKRDVDVNLTLVGDGNFRSELETLCNDLDVSDRVVFIGATSNPYPYMSQCDIYLQTSRHEGYCITLAEARLFGKPIVATNFTGAREQLSKYSISRIVSHNPEEIAAGIQDIITLNLHNSKNPIVDDTNSDYYKLLELLM